MLILILNIFLLICYLQIFAFLALYGYIFFVVLWDAIFQHEMIVAISSWLQVTIQDVKDYVGAIAGKIV